MEDSTASKMQFNYHCLVGVILDSIRRNGIDKTIEDLRGKCRLSPVSDEDTYQDFLNVVNGVSEKRESAYRKNN